MMAEQAAITLADIAEWLPAPETLRIVAESFGDDEYVAKRAILHRLIGGMLTAAAENQAWQNYPKGSTGPTLIGVEFWSHTVRDAIDQMWAAGDLVVHRSYYDGSGDVVVRYYSVKFDPAGVRALVANAPKKQPAPVTTPSAETPAKDKGGRPRNEWWEDFWIDICVQIYDGTLVPKKQADVERAMLDWATKHGHELSEAYARQKARKLFTRFQTGRLKT